MSVELWLVISSYKRGSTTCPPPNVNDPAVDNSDSDSDSDTVSDNDSDSDSDSANDNDSDSDRCIVIPL